MGLGVLARVKGSFAGDLAYAFSSQSQAVSVVDQTVEDGIGRSDHSKRVRGLIHAYGQCYRIDWPLTTWNKQRDGFNPAPWLLQVKAAREGDEAGA